MKILCIENEKEMLEVIVEILKETALPEDEIFGAESGEEGLHLLQARPVDLVLTDLRMRGVSGLEVLIEAKKLYPTIEVIVFTGYVSIDTAIEAIKSGARDYLTKPLNMTLLIEKIATIRDIVNSRKEAEDYRFAKQQVEDQAGREITRYEALITRFNECQSKVCSILNGVLSDSAKVALVKELFEQEKKDSQ